MLDELTCFDPLMEFTPIKYILGQMACVIVQAQFNLLEEIASRFGIQHG